MVLRFPETEPLSPPILQLNEVGFYYSKERVIFSDVNLGATLESRICIVSILKIFIMGEKDYILIPFNEKNTVD